jgi:cell division septal protein FtsQ
VNSLLDMPRPSLLWRVFRVVAAGVIGAAVVTAAVLAGHRVVEGEEFRVYTVDIQTSDGTAWDLASTPRVSAAQLRHLVDVRQGQHVATVRTSEVARAVERHPWVTSATVRLELPSTLQVTVTEHQPVMLLALDALWYVDATGQPFHRASSEDLDYPILTGLDAALVDDHPELASAVIGRALGLLEHAAAPPLHGTAAISEVRFHRRSGFALVLRSGTELRLGFSEPASQLARLNQMVGQGLDLSVPQRIDLHAARVAIATPLPTM